MPFDSGNVEMTRLAKLQRLDEILKGMDDESQGSFGTCLWPRAIEDAALRMAGLPMMYRSASFNYPYGEPQEYPDVCRFLGVRVYGILWSSDTVADKRRALARMIAREKKKARAEQALATV